MELAENDSENQKNQNRNNRNSDHPIGSHPKQHTRGQQSRLYIEEQDKRGVSTYGPCPSKS